MSILDAQSIDAVRRPEPALSGAQGPDPPGAAEPAQPRASHEHQARGCGAGAPERHRQHPRARDRVHAAEPVRAREPRHDVLNELFGLGPLEQLLADAGCVGHPRQPSRPGLRREARQARGDRASSSGTTGTSCRSSSASSARSVDASTSRPRWRTRDCSTARVSTPSSRRSPSTARRFPSGGSAPTSSAPRTSSPGTA